MVSVRELRPVDQRIIRLDVEDISAMIGSATLIVYGVPGLYGVNEAARIISLVGMRYRAGISVDIIIYFTFTIISAVPIIVKLTIGTHVYGVSLATCALVYVNVTAALCTVIAKIVDLISVILVALPNHFVLVCPVFLNDILIITVQTEVPIIYAITTSKRTIVESEVHIHIVVFILFPPCIDIAIRAADKNICLTPVAVVVLILGRFPRAYLAILVVVLNEYRKCSLNVSAYTILIVEISLGGYLRKTVAVNILADSIGLVFLTNKLYGISVLIIGPFLGILTD